MEVVMWRLLVLVVALAGCEARAVCRAYVEAEDQCGHGYARRDPEWCDLAREHHDPETWVEDMKCMTEEVCRVGRHGRHGWPPGNLECGVDWHESSRDHHDRVGL